MPIASRTLTLLATRDDLGVGVKTWRVTGANLLGRPWKYGSFKVTQAEAEVIRDAITAESLGLAETDLGELLAWVQGRNTVATFDFTDRDITKAEGEEHILKWFAESMGVEAITVAWWLDDINTGAFNRILSRVGYTGDEGAEITDRFSQLVVVEPFYDLTVKAP